MLMAQKNNDKLYARLILDELKSGSPDFDRLCSYVLETQTLTSSGSKGRSNNKEVHLSSIEGKGSFKGKCTNCGKVCKCKAYQCKEHKGEFHGDRTHGDSGGNTNTDNPNHMFNFCGLAGHKETGYFPAWFK